MYLTIHYDGRTFIADNISSEFNTHEFRDGLAIDGQAARFPLTDGSILVLGTEAMKRATFLFTEEKPE